MSGGVGVRCGYGATRLRPAAPPVPRMPRSPTRRQRARRTRALPSHVPQQFVCIPPDAAAFPTPQQGVAAAEYAAKRCDEARETLDALMQLQRDDDGALALLSMTLLAAAAVIASARHPTR
jgi:hypothetical protein